MKVRQITILKVFLTVLCVLFFTVNYSTAECLSVPLQEALDVMAGDAEVSVTTVDNETNVLLNGWIDPKFYHEFTPTGSTPTEALILYTGGTVDERAYAPMARDIAAAGYFVVLVASPGCLAITEKERVDDIISAHSEIEKWSIGGHSFGGVVAAMYIEDSTGEYLNEDKIDGLVFWASYPANNAMLSVAGLKIASIYGTLDGATELIDIENSIPDLPEDTRFVALEGANHTQFGWYGNNATDYDFIQTDDNPATITRQEQQDLIVAYTVSFLDSLTPEIPASLESVTAEDGSVWERVNVPGFDAVDNISVVAMAEYQGRLYAMTRNQDNGAEVWRTTGAGWEQVLFPGGETNGVYGNMVLNNVWARMIEFQDKLYFGFSSGLQGNFLGSSGCEIWTYDGVMWQPVISDKKDVDEEGLITSISGCGDADGNTTAQITDDTKSWTGDQWAGATLQITSGDGENRKFNIISNTDDTLTIQQDETAGTGADLASETEFTVCDNATYSNPYPKYSYILGAVIAGDSYEIGLDEDENGFGDYWNKTITDMLLFDGKLYVSTGLNYAHGAQIWYTADGDNWNVTQAATGNGPLTNSYGNYHNDPLYPNGLKAVSSSLTNMTVFNDELYGGGTGTGGEQGSCSRMAKMTSEGWELIIDANVDNDTTGTNENGFGDGMDCDMDTGNFMPWSIESFNDKLMVGINSLGGLRMLYSETPTADDTDPFGDPTWKYSVGGDAAFPPGFNDVASNPVWGHDNIAANLFEFNNEMYAGVVTLYIPEYGATITHGAPIWKTSDGTSWTPVTTNGLDDTDVIIFEAFTDFGGTLYVSASKGASSTPQGLGGAKVYRMVSSCTVIALKDYDLCIWDFSDTYAESQDGMTLSYMLVQDPKGKVTGSGNFEYSSDEIAMSIPVEIKGNVKGKNSIVTLKYKVKGKDTEGNKIQNNLKLELDESILSLVGTEKMKVCQKGAGCEKTDDEGVSLDVPVGMTGEALISIDATLDAKGNKLEGTAELTLSNDDVYPLGAKGKYNSKKEETQFQLKGVEKSTKGIKFKLKIDEESDAATFINGKALGQQLKYKLE